MREECKLCCNPYSTHRFSLLRLRLSCELLPHPRHLSVKDDSLLIKQPLEQTIVPRHLLSGIGFDPRSTLLCLFALENGVTVQLSRVAQLRRHCVRLGHLRGGVVESWREVN